MLFPRSYAWTPLQKWLILASGAASISLLSILVYHFERYHALPDDSFFVGTWRGEYHPHSLYLGPRDLSFHFRRDHTYDGETVPSGRWFAAGDFLYLRARYDDASGPYDQLEAWHIDSMSADEVLMHYESMHVAMKRSE
jgi:hypothetical protein